MPIAIQDLDGGITKVILSGRIDIAHAHELDMPMSVVGGSRRSVVIDLSGVDFMASMGLRTLVVTAKSILNKKGRVVLLSPQPMVADVLHTSGIDELIPVHHDEGAAVAAVNPV